MMVLYRTINFYNRNEDEKTEFNDRNDEKL